MDEQPDKIERLFGQMDKLTEDELRLRIRTVRHDRRMAKQRASARAKARVNSDEARVKATKLLDQMDDATRDRLLKELEDG